MQSAQISRRFMLGLMGTTAALPLLGDSFIARALAADDKTLTIAYNVNLPSFDPTVGASAVNPTIQSLYQAIFDPYIAQNADLTFKPGLLTKWGWNADRSKIEMEVREGATWHNGDPVTAEDIVWSLQRAGDPKTGNPIQFVWGKVGNFQIDGNKITADVLKDDKGNSLFEPTLFKWMAFLTGYVLPKKYYESVGAEGFEKKPIGSGPYMVDEFQQNAFLRLKANPNYWGGKPAFDTVIFKFIPDPTSRVAEVESGSSDITLEIPYEEFDRLKEKGFTGYATPISDIGMIFINDVEPMLDKNVRLAANYAIDKKAIVDKLLRGYGVPIDTLEAPGYAAFDPSIKIPYDPEKAKELLAASGFSPEKPVKFKIQTTRGFKPKDYEMIQAIVGMWRKVGIEAEIEVYEIAKHYELRAGDQLAPAAFYNWGNSIGDPSTSTGFAMFGPSPHSVWDGADVIQMIGPLWGEPDEEKRIAGYKAVAKHIAEEGEVIPLLQYVQPIIARKGITLVPQANGMLLPQTVTPG
jgi:peptide/nickel transport system substrate-binding protein